MQLSKILLPFLCLLGFSLSCTVPECDEYLKRIKLPAGFRISYYAKHVPNARSLFISPSNVLYIGTRNRGQGQVFAALDKDNDGVAETVISITSGWVEPNGIAHRNGDLYVVDSTRIIYFKDIDNLLLTTGKAPLGKVLRNDLPVQSNHKWRYAAFNPDLSDPNLYIAIGANCNTCPESGLFATIVKVNATNIETAPYQIVARGIRNTVGFTWHPLTKEMWFTDNGRDLWGDNKPGDELNRIDPKTPTNNLHYGFPFCYNNDLVDDVYNKEGNCSKYLPPAQILGPHVASLGVLFYSGKNFPDEYSLNAIIAEHGSWDRSIPIGFRVTRVKMNKEGTGPEGPLSYSVLADGWLPEGATQASRAFGRPVDVKLLKDGSLLVSDDKNEAVYRIYYDPAFNSNQNSSSQLMASFIMLILASFFFAILI